MKRHHLSDSELYAQWRLAKLQRAQTITKRGALTAAAYDDRFALEVQRRSESREQLFAAARALLAQS